MHLAALAWSDSADDLGSVVDRGLRVETCFTSSESLKQHAGILVDEHAHAASPTTFSAASFMPSATVKLKPEFSRISRPFSTLVPSIRTTIGTFTLNSRAALTTPVASV